MKHRVIRNGALVFATALTLAACSSDDDNGGALNSGDDTAIGGVDGSSDVDSTIEGVDEADDLNEVANGAGDCPIIGNLTTLELGENQCQVTGVLTENAVLPSGQTWFLEGALQIGSAEIAATLDIEAGTQIRGDNQDAVDHVLVYPGSALRANGTSANPVHFLSDDDNVDGRGEWGGVFLRGYNGLTTTGTQGANRLDYVVVAEAGSAVEVTIDSQTVTYQDNLVLNGVDSSTTMTFVQSHNSARDGFRITNGDPRMSWILATGSMRDGIWYRDFSGLVKDLMVIHDRDSDGSVGRSGIYASESETGDSNPRIVNATLVGRDNSSIGAGEGEREFGILFADNTDQIRLGNVLIANFRNGCYEAASGADLSSIDVTTPGPNYLDGVHCAHEAGPNGTFGIVREGSVGLPAETVAPNNSNGDGLVYYNGAGAALPTANTEFNNASGGINFTGELVDRTNNFTAGWYLNNIRGIANGLVADSTSLSAFLDGDTNNDGVVDTADTNSTFVVGDDGEGGFNQDVASDTGGYDLTHIGAVRGGAVSNTQFDGWTVDTGADDSFTVQVNPANL